MDCKGFWELPLGNIIVICNFGVGVMIWSFVLFIDKSLLPIRSLLTTDRFVIALRANLMMQAIF